MKRMLYVVLLATLVLPTAEARVESEGTHGARELLSEYSEPGLFGAGKSEIFCELKVAKNESPNAASGSNGDVPGKRRAN